MCIRDRAGPRADMPGLRGEAARAERVYREFVHENYLTLPEGFQETAFAWIEEAIQAAGPLMVREPRRDFGAAYEGDIYTAEVISLLLAAVTRYDPATPLTPEGEDFVTYFLSGVDIALIGEMCIRDSAGPGRLLAAGGVAAVG